MKQSEWLKPWRQRERLIQQWLRRGRSQASIALQLGISRQRVHQIVNGKKERA